MLESGPLAWAEGEDQDCFPLLPLSCAEVSRLREKGKLRESRAKAFSLGDVFA